ncbi:hypothetical protein [Actinophytocola algeriensis]|uniref:Endoglucanase Acf2 n=1 Tax=Actinophytocola algeriensis TaxID=1768010 RepID=A0A7W7QDK6_9PSEU|nr:hypothetical protein [Actinophytocola algeriensis]MBB4911483.1 endoglucanase Acf2 [Actinophytocola algeriensis]MBE1473529.1 endoglucanase Acf2 [Actinophytocola algeriensis]
MGRSWTLPVDPDLSDPYTLCRIITMNGIEVESIMFSHNFARVCRDQDVTRKLAEVRYVEAQQQKAANWLLPGQSSPLETNIFYEQVAVDDNVRDPYDRTSAVPLSKMHALTVMSAEQQTMNFYMNVGPQYMEPIARQLYQEIAMIDEEHVTHYESLVDPGETWWERLVLHEYNEVYLYHSFMENESDPKVKAIWELH